MPMVDGQSQLHNCLSTMHFPSVQDVDRRDMTSNNSIPIRAKTRRRIAIPPYMGCRQKSFFHAGSFLKRLSNASFKDFLSTPNAAHSKWDSDSLALFWWMADKTTD